MEEINQYKDYAEFKTQLDNEIKDQALSFVRTGYLLKIARDTEILRESGYKTVAEFAKAEYGLSKDVVSRYIAINDRYSENGYSECIQMEYVGYGFAKLAEMLTLSDEVVASLSPRLTKDEIRQIKEEIKEEKKITDLEVMMESKTEDTEHTLLGRFLYQYFTDNAVQYMELYPHLAHREVDNLHGDIRIVMDIMAPTDEAMLFARISGIGKLMLSIKGEREPIRLTNVRSNEQEIYEWPDFIQELELISRSETLQTATISSQALEPEQHQEPKQERKKESKVVGTKKEERKEAQKIHQKPEQQLESPKQETLPGVEEPPEVVTGEVVEEETEEVALEQPEDEELPEQTNIEDYVEIRRSHSDDEDGGFMINTKLTADDLVQQIMRFDWDMALQTAKDIVKRIEKIKENQKNA